MGLPSLRNHEIRPFPRALGPGLGWLGQPWGWLGQPLAGLAGPWAQGPRAISSFLRLGQPYGLAGLALGPAYWG